MKEIENAWMMTKHGKWKKAMKAFEMEDGRVWFQLTHYNVKVLPREQVFDSLQAAQSILSRSDMWLVHEKGRDLCVTKVKAIMSSGQYSYDAGYIGLVAEDGSLDYRPVDYVRAEAARKNGAKRWPVVFYAEKAALKCALKFVRRRLRELQKKRVKPLESQVQSLQKRLEKLHG